MAARTATLPGMGDERIEVIKDAALKYVDIRDRRMGLTKEEVESKSDLLDLMHEHKLKRYFDSEAEILVEIERQADEKLTVRCGPQTNSEIVKSAIDKVTPGEDEPIATKTMKRSKKKDDGVPRDAEK
jgi:hypothetical protein